MKRVLLTGAFGNVGANALTHLCDRGYETYAFDIQNRRNQGWERRLGKRYSFTTIWGDVRSRESLARAIDQARPEAILHLAAVIAPTAYVIPDVAHQVNVMGTSQLLELAAELTTRPQFVFTSSYAVYGPRNPYRELPPLTAETPLQPGDSYGRHKAAGERMVRASGLPWTIIRLSSVMATDKNWGQTPEFLKFAFLLCWERRAHALDSRDAGLALAQAVDNRRTLERVFNVGGPEESCRIRSRDFFQGVGQARGIPFPASAFRVAHPDVDESWYYEDWVDTRESQEILQYQRHSFADSLRHLRRQVAFSRTFLKLLAPLVRRQVVKESPYYGKPASFSQESMWTLICRTFHLDPDQR